MLIHTLVQTTLVSSIPDAYTNHTPLTSTSMEHSTLDTSLLHYPSIDHPKIHQSTISLSVPILTFRPLSISTSSYAFRNNDSSSREVCPPPSLSPARFCIPSLPLLYSERSTFSLNKPVCETSALPCPSSVPAPMPPHPLAL